MSFNRSDSGISNTHLFYDCDLILYTEGGIKSFSLDEVANGMFGTFSIDIKFWKNIFDSSGCSKKIEYRALGSKTSSKNLCEKILNGQISNVAVAKDRDLDDFIDGVQDSPHIVYTKGYSWENDVFTKQLTLRQLEAFLPIANIPEEAIELVNSAFAEFEIYGKNLVKIEILFRRSGVKFLTDMSGERFFSSKKPYINKNEVRKIYTQKKTLVQRPVSFGLSLAEASTFRFIYGKLLKALSFTTICHICKKFSGPKSISSDIFTASMIDKFAQHLQNSPDSYYTQIVHRLENTG